MKKIGLIDVDGHNFPNIPLMKISAWHKEQGDRVEWYDPLLSGHLDKIYMSKVFSFTPDYIYPLDADEIERGGSGYAIRMENGREVYDKSVDRDLPYEIEHIYPDYSIYPELTGYGRPLSQQTAFGFLSRGCPRGCGFCHVKSKEGPRSYKVANLSEFWAGQKNLVLCDPNILACPDHIDLLQQIADSKAKTEFNQGIDIRLVNDRNLEVIKKIRLRRIHLAFDRWQDRGIVEPKLREFAQKTGFDRHKGEVMVYILVNYDTTIEQDIYRIQLCRELNFSPYPMIYDREHAPKIYKELQRWCNNFIFWKCPTFEEYRTEIRNKKTTGRRTQ